MESKNATRTTGDEKMRTKVVLNTGEVLDVAYDDHQGVHTDAGCHFWGDCEAFVVWSRTYKRWMTIPLR